MAEQPAPLSYALPYARISGTPGEGPVMKASVDMVEIEPVGVDALNSLYDLFCCGLKRRPNEPCFGTRIRPDGTVGPYAWQTYAEVSVRIDAVAAALWKLNMVPPTGDGRYLGFYCKNSADWMVIAEACYKTGVTVVPMYDTLGADVVQFIQKQTGCATVVCTAAELEVLLKTNPFADVILTGPFPPALKARCNAAGMRIHTLAELEDAGRAAPHTRVGNAGGRDDVAILCYTSGTTGDPKGAMLSHGNIISAIAMNNHPQLRVFADFTDSTMPQEVHLSYLPLAHIYESVTINTAIYGGAAIGFYQGDTLKILEDLQALRPTFFVSVPRLYNRIYDKITAGLKEASAVKRGLFNHAFSRKLHALQTTGEVESPFWDKLVFGKLQAALGLDRCKTMVTGSAPLAATVKDFMRIAMSARLVEGYGLTETAAVATASIPWDHSNFHVGSPSTGVELKLVDVPDMNYTSATTPPCGEICVRGPNIFKGYYKMPEKTAEDIEPNGWFHTGDIGSWTANGCLRIIDRKKNIFKLAQGEYVAAEKIETVCGRCPLVAQIFIYGDSLQSWLVAAVVPDAEVVASWAKAASLPFSDLPSMLSGPNGEKLRLAILEQIKKAHSEAALAGFELPKKIYVDGELWSVENGLLTPTFKMKRVDLKKKYLPHFDKLYAEGLPSKL